MAGMHTEHYKLNPIFFVLRKIDTCVLNICFADRKVDELEKAISVAARDPALYGIDQAELERRVKWTRTTRTQVTHIHLIFLDMFKSKILVYFTTFSFVMF